MVIGLGAFAPTYAFADEFLVSDGYFYFENPTFVYASEEVTISSENAVYVISDGKVTTYDKKADKAIFENGILAVLNGSNLFVNEELVCSNVLDFALKNGSNYWTMSPGGFNAGTSNSSSVAITLSSGMVGNAMIKSYAGVRPVISVSYGIDVKNGIGTKDEPYI